VILVEKTDFAAGDQRIQRDSGGLAASMHIETTRTSCLDQLLS
jgi:hypothetical protein